MSATPEARAKMPYVDYMRPIIADGDTGLVYAPENSVYIVLTYLQTRWIVICYATDQNVRGDGGYSRIFIVKMTNTV